MKKLSMLVVIVAALALGLAACSSSDSGGTTTSGLNSAQTVTGTVLSASGDPVPGTTVYLPGVTVSAQYVKATRDFSTKVIAADGTVCEDPLAADSSLVAACTAADGTFNMDSSAVATNPTQVVFQRGALRMVQDLSCSADPCALDSTTTTFGGGTTVWPVIAAVTGMFDRMEEVLAKLADSDTSDSTNGSYGRVDSTTGTFVYGSEYGTNLTIIDGTGFTTPTENTTEVTYKTWDTYLDGTNPLITGGVPVYDVVFINCGVSDNYEAALTDAAVRERLDAYVEAGGRLYVTDWSYDHLEQPFPEFMQYENDPADPDTPGALHDAQNGTDGEWVNAVVGETSISMSNWLQGTGIAVNAHDASTPGNPDFDCGTAPYDQVQGALLSNGLIPLGDFLSGWVRMVGPHTGYSPTILISSGAGVDFDGQVDRPLTASMSVGSNGGALIYSSYHTAHSCPTPTFWPQERVLQYLMFEAF